MSSPTMLLPDNFLGLVPIDDRSKSILSEVFGGNYSTILTSVHTSLFSVTFRYFNTALLSIAVVIYAFIIIIGTINTARDGQFLGKNWSGHWISLRVIFGSICAIPVKTGYCVAQYLILLMVMFGIAFADYVWSNVVGETVKNHVPAVVSSEVSNKINTDLAVFMMSNFTKDVLNDPIFSDSSFIPNNNQNVNKNAVPPCTYDYVPVTYQSPKVEYKMVNDNSFTHSAIAGIIYKNKTQMVKQFTCKIEYTTPVTSGFVKSYAQPIKYTGTFAFVPALLDKGLTHFSVVKNDNYIQVKMTDLVWFGTFKVNQLIGQESKDQLTNLLSKYDVYQGNDINYLFVNLIKNPQALGTYNGTTINHTSNQIIDYLEKHSTALTAGCDDSDSNICHIARTKGWWEADQLYLRFDKVLSENLQNLYANFINFSTEADNVENKSEMKIKYNKIYLFYLLYKNSISNLLSSKVTPTLKPIETASHSALTVIPGQYLKKVKNNRTFSTSLVNVRKLFKKMIINSNLSKIDKIQRVNQVNSLLSDGMEYQYAKYLYIIYSLVKSANSMHINDSSIYPQNNSKQTSYLVSHIIIPVLNLFNFFNENGINFGSQSNNVDTSKVTTPAQKILHDIFQKLGTNANSTEPGGLLAKIYRIGNIQKNDKNINFAQQNMSMIQNVQSVGMALIEGTVDSMMGIFNHAKDKLNQIKTDADSQLKSAESDATGWTVASSLSLGLIGNTSSAQISLEYAKVMFNITMQLATFSLSLIWLPLVLFVLTTIFSIGISFALIIPLTPYILFWAGKTAWLLLVIEAMVAAPFVALALVYPEGHEIFGKAEPGIQICLNLILRPVFMILGMIFGIGLTYVVIHYSANGFHIITNSLLNLMPVSDGTNAASYARGIFACMVIFLYATFLSMAFMKCFSLIYVIPDKVLQWIGNNRSEHAGESEIQEFKGAGSQYAQGASQAGGQTMQQGIESEKNVTQTYTQGKADVSQKTSARNSAIGQDASGAAKMAAEAIMG
ncbi:DotA/TraY family protein [Thiotrichales bacterium 19X7-9]|nr:DotA/TraY family protein [Thiotrichales bacterium 19X7-9]